MTLPLSASAVRSLCQRLGYNPATPREPRPRKTYKRGHHMRRVNEATPVPAPTPSLPQKPLDSNVSL